MEAMAAEGWPPNLELWEEAGTVCLFDHFILSRLWHMSSPGVVRRAV